MAQPLFFPWIVRLHTSLICREMFYTVKVPVKVVLPPALNPLRVRTSHRIGFLTPQHLRWSSLDSSRIVFFLNSDLFPRFENLKPTG